MKIIGYSEDQAGEIPELPGLYAFYLDALSPKKVGLLGGDFTQRQLESARDSALARMKRIAKFMRHKEVHGKLGVIGQSSPLSTEYMVTVSEIAAIHVIDELQELPLQNRLELMMTHAPSF